MVDKGSDGPEYINAEMCYSSCDLEICQDGSKES